METAQALYVSQVILGVHFCKEQGLWNLTHDDLHCTTPPGESVCRAGNKTRPIVTRSRPIGIYLHLTTF